MNNIMEDKELILEAAIHSKIYNNTQIKILEYFLNNELEGNIIAPPKHIRDFVEVSRPMVYKGIKGLEKDGIINRIEDKKAEFKFNVSRIEHLLHIYNNNKNRRRIG